MRVWLIILASVSALGLGLAGWAAFGPLDERTALLVRQPNGSIEQGSKLGVHIGNSWSDADRTLRQQANVGKPFHKAGWSNEPNPYVQFLDGPVLVGEAQALYRDTSWQNGVITLRLRDGVVVGIQWSYVGPLFVDT
ncbi:hypothetical protein [Brevundimonas sp. R86498]|uniref:hypothetical protein n=1 Tax=Brevundimonas sp. R86498 TaxID=3093845 RepID=UPI0037C5498E